MSRRLIMIFASIALVCGYLFFGERMRHFGIPMGIAVTAVIILWTLQHQIDWTWAQRKKPELPDEIRKLYRKHDSWFDSLEDEKRVELERRIGMFIAAKDFINQASGGVPDDVKYILAYYAVRLTHTRLDSLLEDYDRIVTYPHPFLSPHYGEQVHTYEVEHIDGTVILAVDQLVASFLQPGVYYQTGLHATAEIFQALFMDESDSLDDSIWKELESVSGVSKERIEEHTGMAQTDPWPVAVHHYFTYKENFEKLAPGLYKQIGSIIESG